MKPRITLSMSKDGELQIHLNEAGRDLLVSELQHLSEQCDHLHLGPEHLDGEVPLQMIPYQDDDQLLEWGKVFFRPDKWDAEYFPHVLKAATNDNS